MDYFITSGLYEGITAMIVLITVPGIAIYYFARKVLRNSIKKQHERVGRLLFRVSASLIALLISLSFANENIAYNKVVDSMEIEASLIASIFSKLNMYEDPEANKLRADLQEYVNLLIKDNWNNTKSNPYFSNVSQSLINTIRKAYDLPVNNDKQERLKFEILEDFNQIMTAAQVRVYSTSFHLPFLIYILLFGMVVIWFFYSVYEYNLLSVLFLSLYNLFIAVVLYFVIMLGNPLAGPLKIEPEPFRILNEKGLLLIDIDNYD
jgi:hypothetical protein